MADLTQVGEKVLVAPDAVLVLLLQDVLLPVQGLLTLGAVVTFGHRGRNLVSLVRSDIQKPDDQR